IVQISTNLTSGAVSLDGKQVASLTDGQFFMEDVPSGLHTLSILGSDAEASLTFEARPGQLPALTSAPVAKQSQIIVVSSLGRGLHVSCNCAEEVLLDGNKTGELGPNGLSINDLSPGAHVITVKGPSERTVAVHTRPAPGLDVFVASNSNVGTLVLETNEDGVAVLLNGKTYGRRTAQGGIRIPLAENSYTVRVEKKGFRPSISQQAEIRRNTDTRLVFKLEPRPAELRMRAGTPGAQISIDGQPGGLVSRTGSFSLSVTPGEHLIEATKSGFRPSGIRKNFYPGETISLNGDELRLREIEQPAATPTQQTRVADTKLPPAATPTPPSISEAAQEWERISGTREA